MRLISKADAAKLEKDPKAEVKTFYVENAKGNSIPKHFMAEENKDKKKITINGVETTVARNVERSQYVAFCLGTEEKPECHYIRDHDFMDGKEYVTYVKPKPEPKPKKEKVAKTEAADGAEGTPAKEPKAKGGAAAEKAAREARTAKA